MGNPVVPQDADEIGRRIRLHRIEGAPAKAVRKETRGTRRGVRTVENDRFVGREGFDYGSSVRISGQFKGPPKR